MFVTLFLNLKGKIFQTVFIYVLQIQDITAFITLKSIRPVVFLMEIHYLQCAVEIEILSI